MNETLKEITDRGNDAEVRNVSDGSSDVFEVEKKKRKPPKEARTISRYTLGYSGRRAKRADSFTAEAVVLPALFCFSHNGPVPAEKGENGPLGGGSHLRTRQDVNQQGKPAKNDQEVKKPSRARH